MEYAVEQNNNKLTTYSSYLCFIFLTAPLVLYGKYGTLCSFDPPTQSTILHYIYFMDLCDAYFRCCGAHYKTSDHKSPV